MEQLYRIHGRALMTDCTWTGTGLFPEAEARLYVEQMNAEQKSLPGYRGPAEYWIEPAERVTREP